jgi:cob(I)alamin adenosyltransferase
MGDMKKSNVYTKTGDRGTTSLVGGKRVSKSDVRIESYGTTDELNAFVGLLMTEAGDREDLDFLRFVQHKLFTVGSYLATDPENTELRIESRVRPESIARVEQEIDRIDSALPPVKHFLLPGGGRAAALAHVCRTVCRRAERQLYRLQETAQMEDAVLIFVNRLSDYFFVLARKECILHNGEEIIWDSSCI